MAQTRFQDNKVNTMAADALAPHVTMASATMVLAVRLIGLTHLPLLMHICVSESGLYWFG